MPRTRHDRDQTDSSNSLNDADSLGKGKNRTKTELIQPAENYERVIEEGNPQEMFKLGHILEKGAEGVQKNLKRAIELYEAAASKGHCLARCRLKCLSTKIVDGMDKDVRKGHQTYKRNVNDGNSMKKNDARGRSQRTSDYINSTERHRKVSQRNERANDERRSMLSNAVRQEENAKREEKATHTSARESRNSWNTKSRCERDILKNSNRASIGSGKHLKKSSRCSVFISHAGPDKHTLAARLHYHLTELGISAFLDFIDLPYGKPVAESIFRAMEEASVFVFILSPEFLANKWPIIELNFALEIFHKAEAMGGDTPWILPLFYRLDVAGCKSEDFGANNEWVSRFGNEKTYEWMRADSHTGKQIRKAIRQVVGFRGVENLEGATNDAEDMGIRELYVLRVISVIIDLY